MTARYIVGDTRQVLAQLADEGVAVDAVITSPPFLALRSYLPADDPMKPLEMGSEPTPGEFIDALLDVVEECRRVLAPHGSLCVELGDTYAGSGGAGGDYAEGGLREHQPKFRAPPVNGKVTARKNTFRTTPRDGYAGGGRGWPLDKSLCLIPESFRFALAYGRNPHTGRTLEPWRVRNVVRWCLDGDTVVYARTPKGEGPVRLLHLTQNWRPGQWDLWDGARWTPVLGWSATEATDAVEIEFRNGERISATREHQWPTARGLLRTENLRVGDVVDSVRLPDADRSEPAGLPDDDIGWLVGTFLADGSFDSRDRIQFSGHRDESALRLHRLGRLADAYDGTCTAHDIGAGNEAVVVLRSTVLAAVIRRYVGGDGARNKTLRAAAWRRSNQFLRAVLDGYLAGDGYYDAKNDRWRLGFTDNGWLARDLRTICARLGYSCRVRRLPRAADPRGGQFAGAANFYHRGDIRVDPGPLVRPDSEIVALRASRRRRFYDIGVEGEPHLFALASGILTHNCRPNPPVGALADKFRPATSEMVIACTSRNRYFDLDAVRTYNNPDRMDEPSGGRPNMEPGLGNQSAGSPGGAWHPAGTPPLDWWRIPTQPYRGAHYATFPEALCITPILAMCPMRVCTVCGKPSERIVEATPEYAAHRAAKGDMLGPAHDVGRGMAARTEKRPGDDPSRNGAQYVTLGWSECGHGSYACATCGVLVPYGDAVRRSREGQSSEASLGGEALLGEPVEGPGIPTNGAGDLRAVRGQLPRPSGSTVLHPELFGEAGACGGASEHDRAADCEPGPEAAPGLLEGVGAGRYAGPDEVGLHAGTPAGDAGAHRPAVRAVGDGAPPQRREDGQPGIEPGDRDPGPSRRDGDLSALPGDVPGQLTWACSCCGGTELRYVEDHWRPGVVLDPFAGSGTTLAVAVGHGRDAIGIDLDRRNVDLALERVGMFLEVEETEHVA